MRIKSIYHQTNRNYGDLIIWLFAYLEWQESNGPPPQEFYEIEIELWFFRFFYLSSFYSQKKQVGSWNDYFLLSQNNIIEQYVGLNAVANLEVRVPEYAKSFQDNLLRCEMYSPLASITFCFACIFEELVQLMTKFVQRNVVEHSLVLLFWVRMWGEILTF